MNDTSAGDGSSERDASDGSVSETGKTTDCAGPIAFADPDVEIKVRAAAGIPTGPISASDVAGLTQLDLIEVDVPAFPVCPPGASPAEGMCIDYSSPPRADGWVTSLAGVECLTHLESLSVDVFALDLAPLQALTHLDKLLVGPVVGSMPPPLPQVRTLECFEAPGSGFLPAFTGLLTLTIDGGGGLGTLTEVSALRELTKLSTTDGDLADLAPLAGLTNLSALDLSGNAIQDLGPLAPLTKLETLNLAQNQITDVSPLLGNSGLGAGAELDLTGNPLDCAAQAANLDALRARHVNVSVDCP